MLFCCVVVDDDGDGVDAGGFGGGGVVGGSFGGVGDVVSKLMVVFCLALRCCRACPRERSSKRCSVLVARYRRVVARD
eukprot:2772668-Rhodomonas_salina.1